MPWSRSTALKTSLSMQSAEASTPAPTYGTPASSSSPCTVPSSPNGPCSTGKTTSTSRERRRDVLAGERGSIPARGLCPDEGRAASGRRGRSRSRAPRRPPTRARAPRSAPTRSRSSSRSTGRRRITAMRRLTASVVVVVVSCPGRAVLLELADVDDHDVPRLGVRARRRVGRLDDAVLRRIGDRIGDDRRREARAREERLGRRLAHPGDVGHLRRRRPLRHRRA